VGVQVLLSAPNKTNPNITVRIFLFGTLIFYFFPLLFSLVRLVFEIRNKKEEIRVN